MWEQLKSGRMSIELLRDIELFRGVPEAELHSLADLGTWRRYEQGKVFVDPNEEKGYVFLLLQGTARIFGKSTGGIDTDVLFLESHRIVDVNDLSPRVASVTHAAVTSETAVIARFPRGPLRETLCHSPESERILHGQTWTFS